MSRVNDNFILVYIMNIIPDSNGPLYLIIFYLNHKVHQGNKGKKVNKGNRGPRGTGK